MRLAGETRTPLVPFGLGSGVCGGIQPDPSMVLVDLSAMSRVREIDETNLLASFDAGLNGLEAEEAVAARGLTIEVNEQSDVAKGISLNIAEISGLSKSILENGINTAKCCEISSSINERLNEQVSFFQV